jgi:hypothetical protein
MTTLMEPETTTTPGRTRMQRNADNGCKICAYALIHHWFGPIAGGKGSHCIDCCRTWTSKVEGHCAVCCAHFANPRAFDMHFGRDDEHLDPATAKRRDGQPRFIARVRPGGTTWAIAFYGKKPKDFGRRAETPADSSEASE